MVHRNYMVPKGQAVKVTAYEAKRSGQYQETYPTERYIGLSESKDIYGLCQRDDPRSLTHMSYGMSYANRQQGLDHAKLLCDGWWFFDVGQTCPIIKVHYMELERAFRELGILE